MHDIGVTPKQDNCTKYPSSSQLEIKLQQNRLGKTIITHKYANHPLCISRPFYLDNYQNRAYLYLGNNSPGLFPKDDFKFSFDCDKNTQLYLTDRAANKVHPHTNLKNIAQVNFEFNIAARAYVEFLPESLILYQDAALEQVTKIKMDSSSTLFLSEIILPGRLARGEFYLFHSYFNRLQVYSLDGDLWFSDGMYLSGINNSFKDSNLFAKYAILGNAIAVLPSSQVKLLQTQIENLAMAHNLLVATSLLPQERGLLIRINGEKTTLIKQYFSTVLNLIRKIHQDCPLPYIPK